MKTGLHDCIKNEDLEASSWSKLIASQTWPQNPKQNLHAIQKNINKRDHLRNIDVARHDGI